MYTHTYTQLSNNLAADDQKNLKQVIQWPGSVIPRSSFAHGPIINLYNTVRRLLPARSWK